MINKTLQPIFQKDLNQLIEEINAYEREENLWKIDKNISNCGGNLCLHLIGNLNHFIGAVLGNTDYVRKRNLEFSQKNVPRSEMIKMVEVTLKMVEKTLENLTEADLEKDYPIIVINKKMSTKFFLLYLSSHLSYHLGQINYHRRLLDI